MQETAQNLAGSCSFVKFGGCFTNLYFYTMAKPYVVGIDIGGTHTVFGIVDAEGHIIACDKIMTGDYPDISDYISSLSRAVTGMIENNGLNGQIEGIGIGAPAVNHNTGVIEGAVDLPWASPIPLKELMEKATGLPVSATNDANAAAIGEQIYGAGKGLSDFIILTLGTGIGSGIVSDGHLVYGHRGLAGELGHTIIRPGGRQCNCGRKGCLETYASARGIVRTAIEMIAEFPDMKSVLSEIPPKDLTSSDIGIAAAKGDQLAIRVLNYTGEILGEACANFCAYSSPQAIVLFGGVTNAGDHLINPIREAMAKHILYIYKDQVEITTSKLPHSDAAVLGAAAAAW